MVEQTKCYQDGIPVRYASNCRCGAAIQNFKHIINDGQLYKIQWRFNAGNTRARTRGSYLIGQWKF